MGIEVIPLVTLNSMWEKAVKLLSMENAVTMAPGDDKKARMIMSYSSAIPHLVRSKSGGEYYCDDNCPHWKSARICSHTLVCAEANRELPAFLEWHCKAGILPNITAVAMEGLPRGRGRKGGRPKRQRKREDQPETVATVPLSGVASTSAQGMCTDSGGASSRLIGTSLFNTCAGSAGTISQSVSLPVVTTFDPYTDSVGISQPISSPACAVTSASVSNLCTDSVGTISQSVSIGFSCATLPPPLIYASTAPTYMANCGPSPSAHSVNPVPPTIPSRYSSSAVAVTDSSTPVGTPISIPNINPFTARF